MENSAKRTKISTRMIFSTAALLAIQAMPSQTYAQAGNQQKSIQKIDVSSSSIFIKIRDTGEKVSIVGFENGNPVFKNSKGEFYTVNGKTGDLIYIKPEEFAKFYCCMKIKMDRTSSPSASASGKRIAHIKMESVIADVTVVGIDKQGNTIQKNARGETFYLDPVTGDMIFVK